MVLMRGKGVSQEDVPPDGRHLMVYCDIDFQLNKEKTGLWTIRICPNRLEVFRTLCRAPTSGCIAGIRTSERLEG